MNFSISSLVKENEDILQHSSYQMMWGRINKSNFILLFLICSSWHCITGMNVHTH